MSWRFRACVLLTGLGGLACGAGTEPRVEAVRVGPPEEVELVQVGEFSFDRGFPENASAFVDPFGRVVVLNAYELLVFDAEGRFLFGDSSESISHVFHFVDVGGEFCATRGPGGDESYSWLDAPDREVGCFRCTPDGVLSTRLCLGDAWAVAADVANGRRWAVIPSWGDGFDIVHGFDVSGRPLGSIDRAPDGWLWREIYSLACDREGDLAVLHGPSTNPECGFSREPYPYRSPSEDVVVALFDADREVVGAVDISELDTPYSLRRFRLCLAPDWILLGRNRSAYLVHRRDGYALEAVQAPGSDRWGFGLSPAGDECLAIDVEGERLLRYLLP